MRYLKTALGLNALKERSGALSQRQRSAFILFDGTRTSAEVLQATANLGITQADLEHMVALGFLAPANGAGSAPAAAGPAVSQNTPPASAATPPAGDDAFFQAYRIATELASGLGLGGLLLNLAVESAQDSAQLRALLPRLRKALGAEKCLPLEQALHGPEA
ncbi:MAG TPA: hypothetical protein PKA16_15270 [Ottowia sp.]|uniref:hypothetical protein n=1 Tax=Ottowia sp. TaxID=1898956 RepID=UPI002C1B8248|nr:hypothetical protein [Ottowia sp.]HMN22736.1 hypothetical protein [Ottowia sp.]